MCSYKSPTCTARRGAARRGTARHGMARRSYSATPFQTHACTHARTHARTPDRTARAARTPHCETLSRQASPHGRVVSALRRHPTDLAPARAVPLLCTIHATIACSTRCRRAHMSLSTRPWPMQHQIQMVVLFCELVGLPSCICYGPI